MKWNQAVALGGLFIGLAAASVALWRSDDLRVERPDWMKEAPQQQTSAAPAAGPAPADTATPVAIAAAPVQEDAISEMLPANKLADAIAGGPTRMQFTANSAIYPYVANELSAALTKTWQDLHRSKLISEELGKSESLLTRRTDYLLAIWPDMDQAIRSGAVGLEATRRDQETGTERQLGMTCFLTKSRLVASIVTDNWVVKLTFNEKTGYYEHLYRRLIDGIGKEETK